MNNHFIRDFTLFVMLLFIACSSYYVLEHFGDRSSGFPNSSNYEFSNRYINNNKEEEFVNNTIEFEYYDLMHPDTIYFRFFANTIEYGSEQGHDIFCVEYYKYCFAKNIEQDQLRDELSTAIAFILFIMDEAKNFQLGKSHLQRRVPAYIEYELLSYSRGIGVEGGNGDVDNIILLLKGILNGNGTKSCIDLKSKLRGILKTEFARKATHRFVINHLAHLKN